MKEQNMFQKVTLVDNINNALAKLNEAMSELDIKKTIGATYSLFTLSSYYLSEADKQNIRMMLNSLDTSNISETFKRIQQIVDIILQRLTYAGLFPLKSGSIIIAANYFEDVETIYKEKYDIIMKNALEKIVSNMKYEEIKKEDIQKEYEEELGEEVSENVKTE